MSATKKKGSKNGKAAGNKPTASARESTDRAPDDVRPIIAAMRQMYRNQGHPLGNLTPKELDEHLAKKRVAEDEERDRQQAKFVAEQIRAKARETLKGVPRNLQRIWGLLDLIDGHEESNSEIDDLTFLGRAALNEIGTKMEQALANLDMLDCGETAWFLSDEPKNEAREYDEKAGSIERVVAKAAEAHHG